MAIIALKAWYLENYEPISELEDRSHDLRLAKNSLLKSALRADFLEDIEEVKQADWFQRYLEGDRVEFYIEGSGIYAIANIDLISHEIYFSKQDSLSNLDPTIFLSYQTEYTDSSDQLREELESFINKFNKKSRIPLTLKESHRLSQGAVRLNSTLMRQIRRSLIYIADTTPILGIDGNPPQLVPSPKVCVEMGYALQSKRPEQILLSQMERSDIPGQFPFDTPTENRISFTKKSELKKELSDRLQTRLQRFSLTS